MIQFLPQRKYMLLHSHAWNSREAKRPALSVALISKKASMRVNEWAMGWRVGATCAMPFGLWLKGWVWAILCSSQGVFCKGKSPLATATYSSAPVQYLQPIAATDIYCSKGRWRRGLGSARSTTHCMRERKSLLIMSIGHQCVPWAYATSYTSRVSS